MSDTITKDKMIDTLYYIDEERGNESLADFFEQFDYTIALAIAHKVGSATLQDKGWLLIENAYNELVSLGFVDEDEDDTV